MINETIGITTNDGVAEAYVSRPDDGDHRPVLFYMDAIGLRPRIEEMADRIAGWGYVVMAPNVFYRDGNAAHLRPTDDLTIPENREKFFGAAMARVHGLTPDKTVRDAQAYVDRLLGLPGVDGARLGITGYCMGGALALRTAAAIPDSVAAVGSFHGGNLVNDKADSPHRQLAGIAAEVYVAHADHDHSMTPARIALFESALEQAGLTYTSEVYQGAAHGFTMSDTAVYDEQATERHFRELEALLARAAHQ